MGGPRLSGPPVKGNQTDNLLFQRQHFSDMMKPTSTFSSETELHAVAAFGLGRDQGPQSVKDDRDLRNV
ncbi:hypothetical protein QCA50_014956 [Cerrena zonata]|uniref:Uncharacterized protein n=1 Tax=Cerrena zonata TaxID=2478898 RepID=A0AAW0FRT5_9APHY